MVSPTRRLAGTIVSRVAYRVWQALVGIHPRLEARDLAEARRWLSPAQFDLWLRQSPRDQAHTLRVARLLRARGHTARPLMQAALLHDVGKIAGRPRLIHRTIWVLAKFLPPRWQAALIADRGWRRPFWALAEHPRLGAEMARAAGSDDDVVWLIAHHQDAGVGEESERARWLDALKEADRQT